MPISDGAVMRRINRKSARLALLGLVFAAGCRFEVGEAEDLDGSVRAMLSASADAWNRGDLDGFVSIYANAPSTSFMTPDGPIHGIDSIRAAYAPAFDGGVRDSLRFENLTVRPIPPLMAVVTGRYVLERGDSLSSNGWFTLVLRRVNEGWRVVHDHSSESPLPAGTAAPTPASTMQLEAS